MPSEAARVLELGPRLAKSDHAREWISSFQRYAFPRIGKMPVVGGNPRRRAGGPIWHEKVETARAPTVMLAVA